MTFASALRPTLAAVLSLLGLAGQALAEEPILLRERFACGYQYHVSARVELSGALDLPAEKNQVSPKTLAIAGKSAIEYDERILTIAGDDRVSKTARIYRRINFRRTIGDQLQENTIRPVVRRLIVLHHQQAKIPFSPDGPLTWPEIDLIRTDVFTPALVGLFAQKPIQPGERWPAAEAAIRELTDLQRIDEGTVECRFESIAILEKRRHARVSFSGTVRGINEDGPNRQKLEGYYFFDLDSNHLSYLYLNGISYMLDKDGKPAGKVEGRFVLTRQAPHASSDLSDDALRNVGQEPGADNTLLLYDNPELGVRFLYPRRWRAARANQQQLSLDESHGSGLLITVGASNQTPTGAQYLNEVNSWLRQQKAVVQRMDPVRKWQGGEQFAVDVELGGKRLFLKYVIVAQAAGGATLAARLTPTDQDILQCDVEEIARSLTVTRALPPSVPK